ncbi:hypothetical protein LLH23_15665 [bacterium]|nr:hypothetical protein [bacterium]
MQIAYVPALVVVLLLVLAVALPAGAAPLSAAEAAAWQQWLVPLPKEADLTGKRTVPLADLRLKLPAQPTELDQCLAAELAAALGDRAGAKLDLLSPAGKATLDFTRTPAARTALAGKRNADQGYVLIAAATFARCDALTDVGSYYGMKTLKQLLLSSLRGTGAAATVDLPLGRILDWPDLEERGQWGGTCTQDLEALSDLKSNLIELHAKLKVDEQGVPQATMDTEVMARARRHAVRIVPIIHHLEQLPGTGMFQAYPQLAAVDAPSTNPSVRNVCFSRPEIVKVVGGWMADLGQIPGVSEVMVWLSEEGKGCQCEQCKQVDRFESEVRALTAAWNEAKKTCPKLGLRVLLTQFSYPSNDKVLAALAPGMKVSYYHGGLTYNTERKPMIYPLLEDYVQRSGWMGVYPTLSSSWLTVAPFSNPEFTHARLTEFVDKGLTCLVAYIVPTAAYYQVNTEGGLEWAWNAHGRTRQEFATSFAVRHGFKDPAQFVQWTELIGPPAWDLYASNYPYLESWGKPTVQVAAGRMKLALGTSMFSCFKTPEQFTTNISRCDEALKVATALGEPQFILETEIVRAYTQVLQGVYQLGQILPRSAGAQGDKGLAPEDREAAGKWFHQCQTALDLLQADYPKWHEACNAGAGGKAPERFSRTAQLMEQLAADLGDLMAKHGFTDEGKPYRMHQIGSWKSEEFKEARSQSRRLDVTLYVAGPGKYWFRPIYRSGLLGLVCTQARLVSFAKDKPEELREEAVDKHQCHAGGWVKDDVYLVELKQYDPARGYALIADIGGGDSTNGDFFFKKLRE